MKIIKTISKYAFLLGSVLFVSLDSSAIQSLVSNKFYVGIDSQRMIFINSNNYIPELGTSPSMGGSAVSLMPGIGIKSGYRWDNIGVEVGYTFSYLSANGSYSTDYVNRYAIDYTSVTRINSNIYLDSYYYYPFSNALELKAMLGVGRVHSKISGYGTQEFYNSGIIRYIHGSASGSGSIGLRVGAGVQYNINNHFSVDGMYKYQKCNYLYNHMVSLGIGASYHF